MAWRSVIGINVQLCRATERWLRVPTDKTLWQFEDEAAALIRGLPDGAAVPDLAGGRECVLATCFPQPTKGSSAQRAFPRRNHGSPGHNQDTSMPSTRYSYYMQATSSSHVISVHTDWPHRQRSGQLVDAA